MGRFSRLGLRRLGAKRTTLAKRAGIREKPIDLAEVLAANLKLCGFPAFQREHRFHPKRMWRSDIAFLEQRVAVECEGGIWMAGGAHSLPSNIDRDIEKQNALVALGWRPYRCTGKMIKSGRAIEELRILLCLDR